jgi:hypothetical protein
MKFVITAVIALLLCGGVPLHCQDQLDVAWTTYFGGSGNDEARAVVVDSNDNVYVCGVVEGSDFPPPVNVPTSFDNGPGGFLASFSPDGTLRWLQYFGCVRPHELVITRNGVLLMAGQTADECGGGSADGTVSLFNTSGERLGRDYTFDGSKDDMVTCIDVQDDPTNGAEVVFVAGITQSNDFPVTPNAPQAAYQGGSPGPEGTGDGFVASLRIVPVGNVLQLEAAVVTYFGGPGLDEVLALRVGQEDGKASKIYIGGRTRSSKLPAPGIQQPDRLGAASDDDGFVACLDASSLEGKWMMFLGALGNQAVHGLQTEAVPTANPTTGNRIRVCGVNNGSNFPWPGDQTRQPILYQGGSALGGDVFYLEIQERFNPTQNITDAFVAQVSGVASFEDDFPGAFARTPDTLDRIVMFSDGIVTSAGGSTNFNAYIYSSDLNRSYVREYRGNADEFILDQNQARFGFGGYDVGRKSRYICGRTSSTVLPGTSAAGPIFQRASKGGIDAYIVKLGCEGLKATISASDTVICSPSDTVTLRIQPSPDNLRWDDGSTSATRVVRSSGTYRVSYRLPGGCDVVDSVFIKGGITPSGKLVPSDTIDLCETDSALIWVSGKYINSVVWSGGEKVNDTTIRVTSPGTYTATIASEDGCTVTTNAVTVVSSQLGAGGNVRVEILNKDSITVSDTLLLLVRLDVPPNTDITTLPLTWSASLRFDRWLFFPARPLTRGVTDDSSRIVPVAGTRAATSDTLGILALRVALGDTDTTDIILDSLQFFTCSQLSSPIKIRVRIAGICQAGGTKRFVTTTRSQARVVVAPNPVSGNSATVTATGEDLQQVTARVVDLLGQSIELARVEHIDGEHEWLLPSWLPSGRYVVMVQTPIATSTANFEVVR